MAAIGLLVANVAPAGSVVWTGAGAAENGNTNWSDVNNWSGGLPQPIDSVFFFDRGNDAAEGVVNNVVDGNTTALSLEYGNTNGFHTTQINPGMNLTVSNTAAANVVFVGTATDNGPNQTSYTTIKGEGTLNVEDTNQASAFVVQQGSADNGTHMAALDMSSLANFNLAAGELMVGAAARTSAPYNWLSGTLYLAATNNIRVNGGPPAVDVGDALSNGGVSCLYLGQSNAIFADSVTVAHAKANATLMFNPALAGLNPVVVISGNTNSRVSTLAIGDFSPQTASSSVTTGLMDLSGGTMNVLADTCDVALGQSGSGSGPTTGTLRLGAGVFNVNRLNAGCANANSAAGMVAGSVWLTNGTLIVNSNLLLGFNDGSSARCTGALTEDNGTVLANEISAGGGTSTVALSGGLLVVSNTMGSAAAPLTSLTVNQGAVLQLRVANDQTNAVLMSVGGDNSGVINIEALPVVSSYPAMYPLIYSPAGGAAGVQFALGTLPNNYQGAISNDNGSMIWLVITNGPNLPKTDVWGGAANNNWDTNTLNWTNNNVSADYREDDLVVFDDSAQATQVNLVGAAPHTPFSWTVTNSVLNYVFTGTNSVSGACGLVKFGSASVMLADSGDSFSGGITVNGGKMVLDEANSSVGGSLTIAPGASVQVGNNDAFGLLPAGAVDDDGSLVFNQTDNSIVATPILGNGSLTQNGAGTLTLTGANGYTGNTAVLRGGLALAEGGSIAGSTNVSVAGATLDISGVPGATLGGSLNLNDSILKLDWAGCKVPCLDLAGASNLVQVAELPPIIFYPTNFTLIQTDNGINGNNFVLSLPAASPAYVGNLVETNQALVLNLTGGPLSGVNATVSFSPTNLGLPLNPAFVGLSYEKMNLTGNFFVASNTALVKMFSQIGPAVLRIGGGTADTTCWGGVSNLTPITASEVDAFAGFIKALPTNWSVIYGINFSVNNPSNCAAEAAYVANALGPRLLGFEIGNEPEAYPGNGIRSNGFTYADFLSQWRPLAAAITNTVPDWAITNGGTGWTLTGPASGGNTNYTVSFAGDESGVISLVTQHYYRAAGTSPGSTMQLLLQPDPKLAGVVANIVSAASSSGLPLGFREDECGSYSNGGVAGVSDAYGAALWSVDFMFTLALNGCQGLNFHGGGRSPYTPLLDNGTTVLQARPEFYGLKMFSLLPRGNVVPATVTLATNLNFTAYGVRQTNGAMSALLNNKDTNDTVVVSVNLGSDVSGAELIELTGPALDSTNGYTLGGAPINVDGTWNGGVQAIVSATNGEVTVDVPPISAILLNPEVAPAHIGFSVTANQLNLTWPINYLGWQLQSNSAGLATTNWFAVPGSCDIDQMQVRFQPGQSNVFYRLSPP